MSSPPVTVRKREPSRLLAAHRLRGERDQTGDPAAAGTVLDPPRGIGQLGETPVVPATCPIPRSEPRAPDNSDEFLQLARPLGKKLPLSGSLLSSTKTACCGFASE